VTFDRLIIVNIYINAITIRSGPQVAFFAGKNGTRSDAWPLAMKSFAALI
jgi:hypothetical protein